jgi:hypothetical protein
MQYVDPEDFFNLDISIQNSFIEQWKPEAGDIFTTRKIYDEIDVVIDTCDKDTTLFGLNNTFKYNIWNGVDKALGPIPLLTYDFLIKYILEKLECKSIEMTIDSTTGEYVAHVYNDTNDYSVFKELGKDMFKAYYRVAILVALRTIPNKEE